jgi:PhnB protein
MRIGYVEGREVRMAVKPVPAGFHTVTPYLVVRNTDALVEFMKRAFGAQVKEAHRGPDGAIVHADVLIGDSHVMLGQSSDRWPDLTGMLHLYVPDADVTFKAAVEAGATPVQEVTDQFYGDRSGGVKDPSGVTWWIATHVEDVPAEEMERRMKEARG